jgi:peptide/nickel transport system substrate-binding protein
MLYRNIGSPPRYKNSPFFANDFCMGKFRPGRTLAGACILAAVLGLIAAAGFTGRPREELLTTTGENGRAGGRLVVALRSEPKTLNPVLAADESSRDVIRCLSGDLISISGASLKTEAALAKTWSISRDGKLYTLRLRQGLRFSDGQEFTADDVEFTFQVYLDEKVHSPQRDLLIVGDKPIELKKLDAWTVQFSLAQPYAAAERIFDGITILPRHLLEKPYREGKFGQSWGLSAQASELAGLGPFRLKTYIPGQRLVLEKNPFYWKQDAAGVRLPYLDELVFLFVPTEDAQVMRFEAGDTDVISRISADNFAVLEKHQTSKSYRLVDLGAGLEYNFLFFNLNDLKSKNLPDVAKKQAWFQDVRFRQAASAAIDRPGIARLIYGGRATPLWSQVTPGNKLWIDDSLPRPPRSLDRARALLKSAGFAWRPDGALMDSQENAVEFSILTSASNAQRSKMATIIQDDLNQIGMNVHIVPLEFRAMIDRFLNTYDYDAAVMGLVSGDADPTADMNVWSSSGETHLWNLSGKPSTPWESEMDTLMQQQLTASDYAKRKRSYDRVQQIVAENVPVICILSPNILDAASGRVGNFRPSIVEPYALWNVDQLYVR